MLLAGCAMLVGCWLHMRQAQLWPRADSLAMAVAATLALAALAWARWQLPSGSTRLRGTRAALAACALAELAFAQANWRAVPRLHDRLAPALWGAQRQVRGVVQGLPARSASGLRFVLAPLAPRDGLPSQLMVSWSAAAGRGLPALRAGQAWSLPLRLRPVHGMANPGGFDTELWLFNQGVGGSASLAGGRAVAAPLRCPGRDRADAWQRVQALRDRLRQRIAAALPGHPRAGTLAALALGDQAAVGAAEWTIYRATGVAHLMAVSGLHITMQAWLAGQLFGAIWRRLRWRGVALALLLPTPLPVALARLLAALAYAAACGLGVPAQRALLMLATAVLARLYARRMAWTQILGGALCAVLAWDPWAVAQPGTWLSFGAVGVLLLADGARPAPVARATGPASPTRLRAAWQGLAAAARAQWAVSLALAPLTLVFFQQVALVSPLANALAIPAVTLAVLPLAVGALLLPPPLDALAWRIAAWLQDLVVQVLGWLASWPLAQWQTATPAAAALAWALPGVLALVLPWPWRLRLPGIGLLLPLLLPAPARLADGRLQAWMADVGQGTAVVLRTRAHVLVFDAGPALGPAQDAAARALLPLLRELRVRRLDLVVLSHGDADHIGGAATLAAAYPGTAAVGSVDARRIRALGFASAARCLAGTRWTWDGVRFAFVHPAADSPLRDDNRGSCVLRAQALGGSLLLTGDLGQREEAALLGVPGMAAGLRSDLLVAGHHGSRGSTSEPFLAAVAPRVVALQAGLLNRYGHPHLEVVQRVLARGLAVRRSDLEGALLWQDREPARLLGWRAGHARFWHLRGFEQAPAGQPRSRAPRARRASPHGRRGRPPHPRRRRLE